MIASIFFVAYDLPSLLSLSPSLSFSPCLFLSLSPSLCLTLSLPPSFSPSLEYSHSLNLSLYLTTDTYLALILSLSLFDSSSRPPSPLHSTSTLLVFFVHTFAQSFPLPLKLLQVNELAGACHSCNSRHYRGQAVDLHNDARTGEYLTTCE